jgi:short-subunit dehydrogenase
MVVVITGASAGIGMELARQLHAAGARLALAARREDRLHELNRELGGSHLVVRCDVAHSADCERLISETIARFGRLDTLICNAGYGSYKRVDETDAAEVRKMLDVDVVGTTECIRCAVPHMLRQELSSGGRGWRGQIMIIASAASRRGTPFIGVYSGAKAAQMAIAEALRVELADVRIAVTSVHPTPTKTEFRQVAESLGKYRLPPSSNFIKTQTAPEAVAAMVKAIRRPRPEVWPWPMAGWLLSAGTLVPRWMDRLMYRYYDGVLRHNGLRPNR